MKKVIVRAPVRADLAGGTLDLWPLYLFHPGARTVNVAISYYAESEVTTLDHDGFEVALSDSEYRQQYRNLQELAADPKVALLARIAEHFRLSGLRIVTRTDAPRGSGLGGSSALSVTLVRAISELAGNAVEGDDLIALVRDLETRLLGVPAGIQDYYPPVYGGLAALHLDPGKVTRHPITIPIAELAQRFVLHYSEVAHFSGTNNWELYKRQIDGRKKIQNGLAEIAKTSAAMERALEHSHWEEAGRLLGEEWSKRKALIDGISTPEIDAAIEAATDGGAWGGKVCGAGGGGCIVFLMPPERRESVIRSLASAPGKVVDAVPVAHGLTIEVSGDDQTAPLFVRTRISTPAPGSLEQLYVSGGKGEYRPFLLAEGIVTHREPRSGTHMSVVRSYVAPIEPKDGRIVWRDARLLDPDTLDIRAVPDHDRRMELGISFDALAQAAARSEEAFRQFLEEREKLQILHNPEFGIYSEPNEGREAFLQRCLDEAKRRLSERSERLESTFRRRIDQLREKSEREQREIEASDDNPSEQPPNDVNVPWGQALYNITSGKPATTEAPQSVRELDYMENIAQIQRAWERELQGLREELNAKASQIEESTITPSGRNIEVTKYLILWADDLP